MRQISNPSAPHLAESTFRRYEHRLEEFILSWPAPLLLKEPGATARTTMVNVRNAINGVIHNPQWPTNVDRTRLASLKEQSVLTTVRDYFFMGRRQDIEVDPPRDLSVGLQVQNPSVAALSAIFTLTAEGHLKHPTVVMGIVPDVRPQPPVVMDDMGDGTFLIL